jgi:hypothetical protein
MGTGVSLKALEDRNAQMRGQEGCQEAQLVLVHHYARHAAEPADTAEPRTPEIKVLEFGPAEVEGADGAVLEPNAGARG